jgi:hypothetical protein
MPKRKPFDGDTRDIEQAMKECNDFSEYRGGCSGV